MHALKTEISFFSVSLNVDATGTDHSACTNRFNLEG
ncbi:MAG: hypothetical protein RL222_1622 [Bacteroidota bacterium]|jgi:hypothetical protein